MPKKNIDKSQPKPTKTIQKKVIPLDVGSLHTEWVRYRGLNSERYKSEAKRLVESKTEELKKEINSDYDLVNSFRKQANEVYSKKIGDMIRKRLNDRNLDFNSFTREQKIKAFNSIRSMYYNCNTKDKLLNDMLDRELETKINGEIFDTKNKLEEENSETDILEEKQRIENIFLNQVRNYELESVRIYNLNEFDRDNPIKLEVIVGTENRNDISYKKFPKLVKHSCRIVIIDYSRLEFIEGNNLKTEFCRTCKDLAKNCDHDDIITNVKLVAVGNVFKLDTNFNPVTSLIEIINHEPKNKNRNNAKSYIWNFTSVEEVFEILARFSADNLNLSIIRRNRMKSAR